VLALLWPTIATLDKLTDYQPEDPRCVSSRPDGDLIGEFGEERRAVVTSRRCPKS
jgi:penicillin-binding protein 1A